MKIEVNVERVKKIPGGVDDVVLIELAAQLAGHRAVPEDEHPVAEHRQVRRVDRGDQDAAAVLGRFLDGIDDVVPGPDVDRLRRFAW